MEVICELDETAKFHALLNQSIWAKYAEYFKKYKMKPARGPQTQFFCNYCSGITGHAN